MDYGKGNELKFLHQTNLDLDRVLQLIIQEGLYNNITFWTLVANCMHPFSYINEPIMNTCHWN